MSKAEDHKEQPKKENAMSPPSGKAPLLLIWVDHLASAVLFTESCFNISLSSHFPIEGLKKASPGTNIRQCIPHLPWLTSLLKVLAQDGRVPLTLNTHLLT